MNDYIYLFKIYNFYINIQYHINEFYFRQTTNIKKKRAEFVQRLQLHTISIMLDCVYMLLKEFLAIFIF